MVPLTPRERVSQRSFSLLIFHHQVSDSLFCHHCNSHVFINLNRINNPTKIMPKSLIGIMIINYSPTHIELKKSSEMMNNIMHSTAQTEYFGASFCL